MLITQFAGGMLSFPVSLVGQLAAAAGAGSGYGALILVVTQALASVITAAFVAPFTSAVTSIQYLDQRIRKEAYDVELMTMAGLIPVRAPVVTPRLRARVPLAADPPLQPSGGEGRSLLRRELLRPEYNDRALLTRFLDWLREQLTKGVDAASGSPPFATLAAMVLFVVLVGGLLWLLSRARTSSRADGGRGPALGDERLTAAQLRARAEAALADGRHEDALVDAFRALAVRQVERARIDDVPGATAHELAGLLAEATPALADRLRAAADRFDLVLYGERPATADEARTVLALDDDLVGVR